MRTRSTLFVLALLIALPVWAATQPAEVEAPEVVPADDVELILTEEAALPGAPADPSVEAFIDELSEKGEDRSLPSCSISGSSCSEGSNTLCVHPSCEYEIGLCICNNGVYSCA